MSEAVGFPSFHQSWFIGLDLGRGGLNQGKVVVITLTNSAGNLQAYWRASKDEDETLSAEVLHEGLAWIASVSASLSRGSHLYLIRDGRRPHHESLDFYHKALVGFEFTLIEFAKSGSPLIHKTAQEPEPGTTVLPEQSTFAALYPCISPQQGILTAPVKFCVPINPKDHTLSELSLLLTALCHSATLSYQPSRLPAPIQWANGLARLSYTDLQKREGWGTLKAHWLQSWDVEGVPAWLLSHRVIFFWIGQSIYPVFNHLSHGLLSIFCNFSKLIKS